MTPMHTHEFAGLGIAITDGEIEVRTPGKTKPDRLRLPVNNVRWRAGGLTHSIKNVGRTRFEALDIELK